MELHERHGYFVGTKPWEDGTVQHILEGRPCTTLEQVREESTPQLVRAFAYFKEVMNFYVIKPYASNRHQLVVDVLRERGVLD